MQPNTSKSTYFLRGVPGNSKVQLRFRSTSLNADTLLLPDTTGSLPSAFPFLEPWFILGVYIFFPKQLWGGWLCPGSRQLWLDSANHSEPISLPGTDLRVYMLPISSQQDGRKGILGALSKVFQPPNKMFFFFFLLLYMDMIPRTTLLILKAWRKLILGHS